MGSINKSHNESDGGIILFQGELILLYCDSVHCEIGGKESVKGRVYLTTHRVVLIVTPFKPNSPVKSLCAPFCAIIKCSVEQPVFSANYIEATVRDEVDSSKSFTFKLKFNKGGAIEFAMTMNRAVAMVGRNPTMQPPPAYNPSPSAQYYQAPPTVYAPGYNCGVPMPVQQFPDQPPIGFIYASTAPPPYPGLGGQGQGQPGPQQPPAYGHPAPSSYPPQVQQQQQNMQYPGQASGPQTGFQVSPDQPFYPSQTNQAGTNQPSGYPSTSQYPNAGPDQQTGYPQPVQEQPSGYPAVPQYPGAPGANQQQSGYPQPGVSDSSGQPPSGAAWPSAPPSNPGWKP